MESLKWRSFVVVEMEVVKTLIPRKVAAPFLFNAECRASLKI